MAPVKKLLQAIPFAGDIVIGATELIPQDAVPIDAIKPLFSPEPDAGQRLRNAISVGGGGFGASALTGGLDAVPAIAEITGVAGEAIGAPKGPQALNDLVGCSPALNVEHYLRSASYAGRNTESNQIIRKAGERCMNVIRNSQRPATLMPR